MSKYPKNKLKKHLLLLALISAIIIFIVSPLLSLLLLDMGFGFELTYPKYVVISEPSINVYREKGNHYPAFEYLAYNQSNICGKLQRGDTIEMNINSSTVEVNGIKYEITYHGYWEGRYQYGNL